MIPFNLHDIDEFTNSTISFVHRNRRYSSTSSQITEGNRGSQWFATPDDRTTTVENKVQYEIEYRPETQITDEVGSKANILR